MSSNTAGESSLVLKIKAEKEGLINEKKKKQKRKRERIVRILFALVYSVSPASGEIPLVISVWD